MDFKVSIHLHVKYLPEKHYCFIFRFLKLSVLHERIIKRYGLEFSTWQIRVKIQNSDLLEQNDLHSKTDE